MYIIFNKCVGVDINLTSDDYNNLIEIEQEFNEVNNSIKIPIDQLDLFIETLIEVKKANIFKS